MFYLIVFLFGITIGSFLNVCIYRIPRGETVVTTPSHCTVCGKKIGWYDLVPVFSYLFLGGRCRSCKSHISPWYPIIEVLNGLLYLLVFAVNGFNFLSIIYSLFSSALLVLSVIDFRTFEIPISINIFIMLLGIVRVGLDFENIFNYVIGFFSVSTPLLIIYLITKGRGIGGGDIKLMAVAGLILGFKLNILAFFMGAVFASIVHPIRMKCFGADRMFALGPYLALGLFISLLFGERLIDMYMLLLK